MISDDPQRQEYEELLEKYLAEAEKLFGRKTKYERRPLQYKEKDAPETQYYMGDVVNPDCAVVWLSDFALTDRNSGIFQLSHEVVHLLSPVEQADGNEVNYLEEGMAVYLSKRITERELNDYHFCNRAITTHQHYYDAYMRYMSLTDIDKSAVKKIRRVRKIIGSVQPDDFKKANLDVPERLIEALLGKFDRSNALSPLA